MEKTFVNPTTARIESFVREELKSVQKGVSARLVYADYIPFGKIKEAPAGIITAHGGNVANSYKYPAQTTSVMIAWVRRHGKKYVRVAVDRVRAQSKPYGGSSMEGTRLFSNPFEHDAWASVFPQRNRSLFERMSQRNRAALARYGEAGQDDRQAIAPYRMRIEAVSPLGMVISDRGGFGGGRKTANAAQVVVTDPATGLRHHISVPPRFGNPDSKTYQEAKDLVKAALAWTFNLKEDEYQPAVEC